MNAENSQVALIEFHDARVEALLLRSDGSACLSFLHLSVFFQKANDLYDVWSCEANLRLELVDEVVLNGVMKPGDYVSEGKLYDALDNEVDPTSLVRACAARRLVLSLAGGASLSARFERANFEPMLPRRKLEEWSGPL